MPNVDTHTLSKRLDRTYTYATKVGGKVESLSEKLETQINITNQLAEEMRELRDSGHPNTVPAQLDTMTLGIFISVMEKLVREVKELEKKVESGRAHAMAERIAVLERLDALDARVTTLQSQMKDQEHYTQDLREKKQSEEMMSKSMEAYRSLLEARD